MDLPDQYNTAVREVRSLRRKIKDAERLADELRAELHKVQDELGRVCQDRDKLQVALNTKDAGQAGSVMTCDPEATCLCGHSASMHALRTSGGCFGRGCKCTEYWQATRPRPVVGGKDGR